MRNFYRIIRLIVLITLFIPQYSSAQKKGPLKVDAQAAGQKFLPDVLLVKFKSYAESPESAVSANALLTINGAVGYERLFKSFKTLPSPKSNVPDLRTVFRVFLAPGSNVKAIAARLSADPRIEYAEPDYFFSIDADPNDPFYPIQFQFPQVKAPAAWDIATGDPTVIVAIIDTGVDWDHPDLASQIWVNPGEDLNANGVFDWPADSNGIDDDENGFIDDVIGWDFVTGQTGDVYPGEDAVVSDNDPMDFHGHGTHVAGIASAATNNARGVASISYGITIMPLRIGWTTSDGGGLGLSSWMALAYIYAADNGAHVTSLSFGNSKTVLTAALAAFKKGVVIVHAAGNGDNEIISDALGTVPWAISVAALTDLDRKAWYSSYGDWVTVSAPGGDFSNDNRRGILSTVVTPSEFYGGNDYVEFSGTSMVSPMVAGLVGLVKSHFPEMSAAELMFQVVETADNIDGVNPSYIGKLGTGRINALRALTTETVVAAPKIHLSSVTVINITGGDEDGVLEAGESADIMVSFENTWGDAINLSATLSSTDWAISIDDDASIFPNMPGLTDLDNNVTDNSADLFSVTVNADAIPHTAEFSLDLIADDYTATFEFQIGVFQPLLFVDDDHRDNNVESYYTDTFNDLNLSYITVENFSDGNPPTNMADFPLVIWGSEWAFPSLDASDRAAIGTYLDGGGNLLIAGQDIGWDLNDPTTIFPNEFFLSGGDSKTWYQNYLRSTYISDDSNNDNMVGVPGDPIGDGLSFSRLQPGLITDEQFPSEISANTGASEVFTYTGSPGNAGAVRYKNAYGVVNFAFGGIESITNSEIRTEIVRRSIAYLTGLDVAFTELTDTETIENYTVTANVTADASIASVTLWWDVDGAFPFNQITMTDNGGGSYSAEIPAQSPTGTEIEYFVLVFDGAGSYNPTHTQSFHAGPDNVAPVVELVESQGNTINQAGPYSFAISATDNIGIDETSATLYYSINGGDEETANLSLENGLFTGNITLEANMAMATGDIITYYFTVLDISSNSNESRLPETGTFMFEITEEELVEDFEGDVSDWNFGSIWELSTIAHLSDFSASTGSYPDNADDALTYEGTFNFSTYENAGLQFWARYGFDLGDICHVEMSRDGVNWTIIHSISGLANWTLFQLAPPEFGGEGNENVRIRFRMVSDGSGNNIGISIDDVFVTSGTVVGIEDEIISALPKEFSLAQNYPNPFNPSTLINYDIPKDSRVRLTVYNLRGQRVRTLVDGDKSAGRYSVNWDSKTESGDVMASGLYFYRIEAHHQKDGATELFTDTKKMLLLR